MEGVLAETTGLSAVLALEPHTPTAIHLRCLIASNSTVVEPIRYGHSPSVRLVPAHTVRLQIRSTAILTRPVRLLSSPILNTVFPYLDRFMVRYSLMQAMYGLSKMSLPAPADNCGPKTFFKDLALGTGVGLRFDISMLVIRGDLGIGIHAPYDTGKRGYYNMESFKKSLAFHLAIGYPF